MNNLAEEQEFEEETVAEALGKAHGNKLDTGDDDDGFEIEVVDDTPEEDRGKPRRAEGADPKVPDDDEIQSYSEGVQKRIKQLKFEYHEERRAKEEALRERQELEALTQKLLNENKELKGTVGKNQTALLEQAKRNADADLNTAKRAYKEAYEAGDADAVVEAQETLTNVKSYCKHYLLLLEWGHEKNHVQGILRIVDRSRA